jgi:hypothetical protein
MKWKFWQREEKPKSPTTSPELTHGELKKIARILKETEQTRKKGLNPKGK